MAHLMQKPVYSTFGPDNVASILAQQLHQAALAIAEARQRGDAVAESAARSRLDSLSKAYRAAGKTDDELDAAKSGGGLGGLFTNLARTTRNVGFLIGGILAIVIALPLLQRKG